MRRKACTLFLFLSMAPFGFSIAMSAEHAELKVFPPAQKGMQRFVVVLPHKKRIEEDASKVELFVGKTMQTDGVNRVRLGAKIESRQLKGWGYTYYEVTGTPPSVSTLMAPTGPESAVKQFVTAPSLLIPYNSRLPVIIYVPEGFQVKYRVWSAADTLLDAELS